MKTKYFLLYGLAAVAFAAVSLWVFFSRGKNAKAIRAKYRLGGIMLICMSMLSAASCGQIGGPGSLVTCYEPVIDIEHQGNLVSLTIKSNDASYKFNELSPGDSVSVNIERPSYGKYVLSLILNNEAGTVLQQTPMNVRETGTHFDIPVSQDVAHRGEAILQVQGVLNEDPLTLTQMCFAAMVVNIR